MLPCTEEVKHDKEDQCEFDPGVLNYLKSTFSDKHQLLRVLRSLPVPPSFTTVRLNTPSDSSLDKLADQLGSRYAISRHPLLKDVVVISGKRTQLPDHTDLPMIVVDMKCGRAVLRGADLFAPGVKGMPHIPAGTTVAVHIDMDKKCKRGEKKFSGRTRFIAKGVTRMTRHDIFKMKVNEGLAIEVYERRIEVPCLNASMGDSMFLQNLPSIITSHVLDPKQGDHILDMCAAPGGKTTHIAHLMNNTGSVIALEKVQGKVEKLKETISKQNITCVSVIKCDSTQAFSETSTSQSTPPFGENVFDKILVDPPCSALGQRPQLVNSCKFSEIETYPSYQWGFVADAIRMLKPGGTLVYSTCTLPRQENEMMVVRLLETFPSICLVPAMPLLGGPGVEVEGLSLEHQKMVQRFTPNMFGDVNNDTIGFFIAKFVKSA